MNCDQLKSFLPDLVFDPSSVPSKVQHHLRACTTCSERFATVQAEMQSTLRVLDEWKAPDPSLYFDVRLKARLQEARQAEPSGFLAQLRARFLYGSGLNLRPAMAAALALTMIVGGGSYMGFVGMGHLSRQPQVTSATVHDLQILDANDQTIQQLNALDDDSGDSTTPAHSAMLQ